MREVFTDFQLELFITNTYYEVEKVFMDEQNNYQLIIPFNPKLPAPTAGELIISDSREYYAVMKIQISECNSENNKTTIHCSMPPLGLDIFKRAVIRVSVQLPVDYIYVKEAAESELTPISTSHHGTIINITPFGAGVEIADKDKMASIYDLKATPLYAKLTFKLPTGTSSKNIEILGKVVNVRSSSKSEFLGILFLINSYHQYRLLEDFYKENVKDIEKGEDLSSLSKRLQNSALHNIGHNI